MSLPDSFETAEEYFESSIKFFKEYQFLYNFHNTDVLLNNILDQIQVSDDLENIYDFQQAWKLKHEDHTFMNEFYRSAEKIKTQYENFVSNDRLERYQTVNGPLSDKKRHEILYLANEIKDLCDKVGCSTVVDFGSGLVSFVCSLATPHTLRFALQYSLSSSSTFCHCVWKTNII